MKIIHRKKFLSVVIFIVLQPLFVYSQLPTCSFNHITNTKGLTHNTVYDICQDHNGFMWFATEVGLNRYDGQHIKQYNYSPLDKRSIPAYTITCLVSTWDNFLFVGTTNGVASYNPKTDDFTTILYAEHSMGHVWSMRQGIGTELLIAGKQHGAFVYNYSTNKILNLISEEKLNMIVSDNENSYWGSSGSTLYRFDRKGKIIDSYKAVSDFFGSTISCLKTDRHGVLWVGTYNNGLFVYDKSTRKFTPIEVCEKIKMYYIRTIEEGVADGEYWIGTERGLYVINTQTNTCEHYTQSFDDKQKTINDNAIYKIYRNNLDIFFIGTYFGGVNVANMRDVGFHTIFPDDRENHLHGKAIGAMAKALNGDLWIATEDAGIAVFNKQKNSFHHLFSYEYNLSSISSNNVHALLMDGDICWAGHFMGGLSKINIATRNAKRFVQKSNSPTSLNNNFIFALTFLSPDSILVGSLSGVDIFNKRTETFSKFRENEFVDCFIYDIFKAPDGKIWFCTYENGIYVLDKTKPGLMTRYTVENNSGLQSNSIISYYIDSKKQIWIGTRGAGLFKFVPTKNKFEYIKPKMLINNVVYGILEDDQNFLWISTNKGISRLNLSDSTAINFEVKHDIAGNQYNYKSYYKDDDGTLYFGSVTGLTWFKPETIVIPNEVPVIYFTNLKIFNKDIIAGDNDKILKQQIDFTNTLKLKHNQNSFTFEFGCINYFNSDIAYQYYLEGFDQDWSPLSGMAQANYTNISSGKYVFHIRSVNKMTNDIGNERIVTIKILSPFWVSWIAYVIYFMVLIAVAYSIFRFYQNRQKEKMSFAIEKIEKENLNLLHQHKMNFFTYITHEFKTPLSIINASVEMLSKNNISKDEENGIRHTIKRSTARLLFLVNQLMDFRKIETDHAIIYPTKGNIIDFFNQIIDTYRPLLDKKNIDLSIKISYTVSEIFFDFDKLEKICTNLLTNATKHTPNGKNIEFTLIVGEQIEFSVKDSGSGLSERQKEKIFEAFYSEDFSNEIVESSGIGLALTASLVKLLKGEILVVSELGKGATFVVKLPYSIFDTTATGINDTVVNLDMPRMMDTENGKDTLLNDKINEAEDERKKEYILVIAEDNTDLLTLLLQNFRDKYRVKCFENGKEAWEYIHKRTPDLVITDIMMPLMSGTELCHKIKTDINLCHIPVIMLTAKTTKEAKLEGLQVGADAYIYKPFLMEELEVRINNLINAKRALKNKLYEIAKVEGLTIPSTNHEQAFIEKILALTQENIENNALNVQFLADELHISRTNLHTKIKNLMNMSSSEFINTVRINKAKELILAEEYTLSEISYKVGYSDAAYFTRVFRKTTGLSPKEFRKSVKEDRK